jgi:hypothetical protein
MTQPQAHYIQHTAELLALGCRPDERPVAALDRSLHRSDGELCSDLAPALAAVRTGRPWAGPSTGGGLHRAAAGHRGS